MPNLDELPDYTRCRTYGHAWFEADSDWFADFAVSRGNPLTLRCDRCTTERREVIGTTGRLENRYYVYPSGYQYSRGERPSKDDFRLALLSLRLKEARSARRNGSTRLKVAR